ncbi:uncharacterized protein LOC110855360 isoform X2 [Folsomia candida]|uniref:uncharacterized protein LOC110855360 isoform X2 n=1 Tax=Folsomia candida TaxID=158441 RepID=UPI001604BE73|nr:uncharacterized protein LOC110855360 isoform X2 [Folsomia candida]
MAEDYVPWPREEVAKISLFWPPEQVHTPKKEIERKLINAMMQTEGALGNYLEIVANLPIQVSQREELTRKWHQSDALRGTHSLFHDMISAVFGVNGKATNIGMFLKAMEQAGWKAGILCLP